LLENLKITIIDELSKTKPTVGITEEQFQEFNANVRHALERVLCDSNEAIDYSSAEFEIDYGNCISVQNIDINTDFITEELDEIMLDRFQEAFGELIINNEQ
jgi:RNA binding exosome subunit